MTIDVRPADGVGLSAAEELEHRQERPRRPPVTTGRRGLWPRRLWFIALLALAAWSYAAATSGGDIFNPGGWSLFQRFFAAAPHPELGADFLAIVVRATAVTAGYAIVGTALSLVIGLIGGVLTSETWWERDPLEDRAGRHRTKRTWLGLRLLAALPRGVHEAVFALLLLRVLGLDPWVAVIAIGVPFGAITAKVVAETIDDSSASTVRALRAAGAGRLAAMVYGVIPTVLPDIVSYGFYRLECSVRSSVVLGMIGAGGLGYQLAISFQTLRYNEIWTLLFALMVLSGAADWWGAGLRRRPSRRRVRVSVAIATVATIVASWWLGLNPTRLFDQRTRDLARQLLGDLWPPKLPAGGWSTLVSSTIDTVQLSVIAISLATAIAIPLAVLAARPEREAGGGHLMALVAGGARFVLLVTRAIPPPVWALLVLFVIFPGPLPGGVALGLYTLGVVGRLDAEAIENSDRRAYRALRQHGVGTVSAVAYGSMPLVAPRFVALSMYRWEVAARETVIVGLVGAGGLGRLLAQQNASFDTGAMLTTIIALIVMSAAIDLTSSRVRLVMR